MSSTFNVEEVLERVRHKAPLPRVVSRNDFLNQELVKRNTEAIHQAHPGLMPGSLDVLAEEALSKVYRRLYQDNAQVVSRAFVEYYVENHLCQLHGVDFDLKPPGRMSEPADEQYTMRYLAKKQSETNYQGMIDPQLLSPSDVPVAQTPVLNPFQLDSGAPLSQPNNPFQLGSGCPVSQPMTFQSGLGVPASQPMNFQSGPRVLGSQPMNFQSGPRVPGSQPMNFQSGLGVPASQPMNFQSGLGVPVSQPITFQPILGVSDFQPTTLPPVPGAPVVQHMALPPAPRARGNRSKKVRHEKRKRSPTPDDSEPEFDPDTFKYTSMPVHPPICRSSMNLMRSVSDLPSLEESAPKKGLNAADMLPKCYTPILKLWRHHMQDRGDPFIREQPGLPKLPELQPFEIPFPTSRDINLCFANDLPQVIAQMEEFDIEMQDWDGGRHSVSLKLGETQDADDIFIQYDFLLLWGDLCKWWGFSS